jgi:hypothetical protein
MDSSGAIAGSFLYCSFRTVRNVQDRSFFALIDKTSSEIPMNSLVACPLRFTVAH